MRSRNLPAVQLASRLPAPASTACSPRARIGGLREPEFYGLALALGGVEVRLDELVGSTPRSRTAACCGR